MQILLFAVDERRQPQAGLYVGTPAIEVEKPARVSVTAVCSIEAHYVEILIFHPDAAQETSTIVLFRRRHVEHQTAHLTEEFAANVIEFVVLLVEAVRVNKDHLQEAVRQVLHGKAEEVADGTHNLL